MYHDLQLSESYIPAMHPTYRVPVDPYMWVGNKLGPVGCEALFFAMGLETAHPTKRILLERLTVSSNEAGKRGAEVRRRKVLRVQPNPTNPNQPPSTPTHQPRSPQALRHVLAGQSNLTSLDLGGNLFGDPGGSAVAVCLADPSMTAPLQEIILR